jgi:predicted metal-dependent hydrolase
MTAEIVNIILDDINVEVIQKNIKHLHLRVYPPNGWVKVSAPKSMAVNTIRLFVNSKMDWIKKQQIKLRAQAREAPREYVDRESHYFNGKRYLLEVIEHNAPAKVRMNSQTIELFVRPQTPREKRRSLLNEWYRQQLKHAVPQIIEKYEKMMDVRVCEFGIKLMKTKWGTCNPKAKRIWLNLELAKKPSECLEYIVVHEMVHLLEPSHNARFVSYMDKFMPKWRFYKEELNRLSIRHEDWRY